MLETLLALPVVPAIKAVLAAVHSDEAWLAVRPPLEPVRGDEARQACAAIGRLFA